MAHVTTITDASAYSIAYQIGEAVGAAGAAEQRAVAADLTAQGFGAGNALFDAMNIAHASQAAAQTWFEANCDLWDRFEVAAYGPGGGANCVLTMNPNTVGGVVAGNFRLDIAAVKNNADNTATYHVRLSLRHSIIG